MTAIDLSGVSVFLAMPTHRDLPPETVRSLLETQATLLRHGIDLDVRMQAGGSLVHHARSIAAWQFLQTGCSHLFWVDSDIDWRAADFIRVVALCTRLECVGGVYPAKHDPPVLFLDTGDPDGKVQANEHGCLPMNGLGLGFTCIQRHVIEELAALAPMARFPDANGGEPIPHIFRCDMHNGFARGEDMAFFADIRALGYVVNLDPTITLGHIGPKTFTASLQDYLTKEA